MISVTQSEPIHCLSELHWVTLAHSDDLVLSCSLNIRCWWAQWTIGAREKNICNTLLSLLLMDGCSTVVHGQRVLGWKVMARLGPSEWLVTVKPKHCKAKPQFNGRTPTAQQTEQIQSSVCDTDTEWQRERGGQTERQKKSQWTQWAVEDTHRPNDFGSYHSFQFSLHKLLAKRPAMQSQW